MTANETNSENKKEATEKKSPPRTERVKEEYDSGDRRYSPRVTIFGAGVTGLSAAHELIERGFEVQVVESRPSNFVEYGCEVGGFAASQYGRTGLTEELYPELFDLGSDYPEWLSWDVPPEGGEFEPGWVPILDKTRQIPEDKRKANLEIIMGLRNRKMRRAQQIFPFTDTIVFGKGSYMLDLDMVDENGVTNDSKLNSVAVAILQAIHLYREDLEVEMRILKAINHDRNIEDPDSVASYDTPEVGDLVRDLHDEARLRETFLIKVNGHHGSSDDDALPLRAWRRAVEVKKALIKKIECALEKPRSKPDELAIAKARRNLENARYAEDIQLDWVVEAFYDFWVKTARFIDDSGKLRSNALFSEQIKNYMILSTDASEERPPLMSEPLKSKNSDCHDPTKQQQAIVNDIRSFNRVSFDVVEHILPGEHGYRFFPSFYKNLFSTMKRTPIVNEIGQETYATIYDNLVMPPATTFAKDGDFLKFQLNRASRSRAAMQENLETTGKFFGASKKDGLLFMNRMLKFATSCQSRRRLYERMSWLEFAYGKSEFDVPDPEQMMKEVNEGKGPYSTSYQAVIRKMPQALVAMKAGESDARSFGVCTLQMFKDYSGDSSDVDMILDGPTSDAWLRPWKRYLKHRGVKFFVGNIKELRKSADTIVPFARGPGPDNPPPRSERPYAKYQETSDYYILATPFQNAGVILQNFVNETGGELLDGDLRTLHDYYQYTVGEPAFEPDPNRPRIDEFDAWQIPRDDLGKPLNPFVQPLRDFTGLQYFWDRRVQIQGGHTYYFNSEWGLTSLPQAFLWRVQPSRTAGYLGQMSIDLGDPYSPWPAAHTRAADHTDRFHPKWTFDEARSIWQSTQYQIAINTWRQIQETFPEGMCRTVPMPNYYHLDNAIYFSENPYLDTTGTAWLDSCVTGNRTPFLIQLPGHFDRLPGKLVPINPDRQQHTDFTYPTRSDYDDFNEIHYTLTAGQWVVAGSMTKTKTRLNTMEGANEAGRYAVNAIVRAVAESRKKGLKASWWDGKPGVMCDYHNIEQDEYPEFNSLKRLDRELMKNNLPHVLDILGTWEYLSNMPQSGSGPVFPKMESFDDLVDCLSNGKMDSVHNPGDHLYRAYEKQMKEHMDFHRENLTRMMKYFMR